MSKLTDNELQILLKEYELHRNELFLRIEHRLKGITFLLTALFIAFGFAMKDKIAEIYLLIPWFLNVALTYMGQQHMCGQLTTAYLNDLERRLKILDYERFIVFRAHLKPKFLRSPYKLLSLLTIIPFFGGYVYCIYEAFNWFDEKHLTSAIVYCGITVLYFIIALSVAIWGLHRDSRLPIREDYLDNHSDTSKAT